MLHIACDTHTHTIFSRHAYSTVEENVRAAAELRFELLSVTDHFSPMVQAEPKTGVDLRDYQQFINLEMWPRRWHGVHLMRGCEADIVDIFNRPMHPYTLGLMASIPDMNQDRSRKLQPIPGSPPDMIHPPKGCPFAPRCPYAMRVCMEEIPPYVATGENRRSMCWLLDPEAPTESNPFRQGREAAV